MKHILDKLTSYTLALRDALDRTNEANERPQITKHLAAAAEIFALLNMHQTTEAIDHIIKKENRSHSLSFLSGKEGQNVEKKWLAFVEATGIEL